MSGYIEGKGWSLTLGDNGFPSFDGKKKVVREMVLKLYGLPPEETKGFTNACAGDNHCLLHNEDTGRVVALGRNYYGQCNLPKLRGKRVEAIACGSNHSLVQVGNTVHGTGDNFYFQCDVPALPSIPLEVICIFAEGNVSGMVVEISSLSDKHVMEAWGKEQEARYKNEEKKKHPERPQRIKFEMGQEEGEEENRVYTIIWGEIKSIHRFKA